MPLNSTVSSFVAGVSAAILVKLTSSIDDVLWLSSFMAPHLGHGMRLQNAITYTGVCLFQTCMAFVLSQFGKSVLDNLLGGSDSDRMPTERLLTLISGSALFIYSIILAVDYYKEHFDDDGELYKNVKGDSSNEGSDSSSEETCDGDKHDTLKPNQNIDLEFALTNSSNGMVALEIDDNVDEDDNDPASAPSIKRSRPLAIIAFLGSLDDLTLFVPLLVGKTFNIIELIIGALIATLMILIICIFLTRCRLIARLLERIPLVAIVAGFSIVLLVKGIWLMG
jgi:hypothetical protein